MTRSMVGDRRGRSARPPCLWLTSTRCRQLPGRSGESGGKRRPVPSEHRQMVASMYIRGLRAVGGAPSVIEQASIDINMAPHSAYAKVRHLEAGVPTYRKTRTCANAAGAC